MPMRKWQTVESKNRFYCDGRCLSGRDVGVFLFALILIIGTSALFFAFDCPYLTEKLSPAIPVFAGILFLNAICCILRTAFSDPGILPRATDDEVRYLERSNITNSPQMVALPGRIIEVQMDTGHVIQLKFCSTCRIFRPPRVSHCSLCDACIANFDHHCPWVGNCVGLRNYRYFYLFLFSLSILCIYIFAFNITNVVLRTQENSTSFTDAIRATPATVVEAVICFFSIWSVVGLWGYHTCLICRGITTNEDIKDTWSSVRPGVTRKNPFSKGNCFLNCFSILCGPLPPSFLDLRAIVYPNDGMTTFRTNDSDEMRRYSPERNGFYQDYRTNTTTVPPYPNQQDHHRSVACDYV